jgi:hypothetical protein
MVMMRLTLAVACLACCDALQVRAAGRGVLRMPVSSSAVRNREARMCSEDAFMASLRARMEKSTDTRGAPPPLAPDEVGADQMGPHDVIDYIMRSLSCADDPEPDNGFRTLMGFAAAYEGAKKVDMLGQLQPGCFASPQELRAFLASEESGRYETLVHLDEWKCMGGPDMSNLSRNAAQKLLVRKDGSNWKDLFVNMALSQPTPDGLSVPRWVVTSIYMSGN